MEPARAYVCDCGEGVPNMINQWRKSQSMATTLKTRSGGVKGGSEGRASRGQGSEKRHEADHM